MSQVDTCLWKSYQFYSILLFWKVLRGIHSVTAGCGSLSPFCLNWLDPGLRNQSQDGWGVRGWEGLSNKPWKAGDQGRHGVKTGRESLARGVSIRRASGEIQQDSLWWLNSAPSPSQKIRPGPNPRSLWVGPYLEIGSLQMLITWRISEWDHPGSGWTLNPMTGVIERKKRQIRDTETWDFPGGPMVKIPHFQYRGACSIPDQRAKIPHASQSKNQKA